MAEQSHRDEMNAAIRAQRQRRAVPRSLAELESAPETPPPAAERAPPPPQPPRGLVRRLLGR